MLSKLTKMNSCAPSTDDTRLFSFSSFFYHFRLQAIKTGETFASNVCSGKEKPFRSAASLLTIHSPVFIIISISHGRICCEFCQFSNENRNVLVHKMKTSTTYRPNVSFTLPSKFRRRARVRTHKQKHSHQSNRLAYKFSFICATPSLFLALIQLMSLNKIFVNFEITQSVNARTISNPFVCHLRC